MHTNEEMRKFMIGQVAHCQKLTEISAEIMANRNDVHLNTIQMAQSKHPFDDNDNPSICSIFDSKKLIGYRMCG